MKKIKYKISLLLSLTLILGGCSKPHKEIAQNPIDDDYKVVISEESETNKENEDNKNDYKDKTNLNSGSLKEEALNTNNKEDSTKEEDKEDKKEDKSYEYDANVIWDKLSSYDYSNNGEKIVFLTFDDGPSVTTPLILDILDKNEVKATFFTLGKSLEKETSKELVKREYKSGHSIGNHTYSHNYSNLYPNRSLNLNNFLAEVNQTNDKLKEILGQDFSTRVIRCPGGFMSWSDMDPLKQHFKNNNLVSMDWNALSGDAEGQPKTPEQLVENAINTSKNKEIVVLLMHDAKGKDNTVTALQDIIDYYKNEGFTFKTLK